MIDFRQDRQVEIVSPFGSVFRTKPGIGEFGITGLLFARFLFVIPGLMRARIAVVGVLLVKTCLVYSQRQCVCVRHLRWDVL